MFLEYHTRHRRFGNRKLVRAFLSSMEGHDVIVANDFPFQEVHMSENVNSPVSHRRLAFRDG
jgi:hypothetical protein